MKTKAREQERKEGRKEKMEAGGVSKQGLMSCGKGSSLFTTTVVVQAWWRHGAAGLEGAHLPWRSRVLGVPVRRGPSAQGRGP